MLRSLRDYMPVWYAADQDYTREKRLRPLLRRTHRNHHHHFAAGRGQRHCRGALFQRRLSDGSGYQLTLLPALEDFPGASLEEDALRIYCLMEEQIRTMPEQYLWVHRRFKTWPEGERQMYPDHKSKRALLKVRHANVCMVFGKGSSAIE